MDNHGTEFIYQLPKRSSSTRKTMLYIHATLPLEDNRQGAGPNIPGVNTIVPHDELSLPTAAAAAAGGRGRRRFALNDSMAQRKNKRKKGKKTKKTRGDTATTI